jgi:hypothetical protein
MDVKDVLGTGDAAKEAIVQVGEIVKSPIDNIADPVTKAVGDGIANLVDLIFTPVQLLKMYKDYKAEQFKQSLAKKLDDIDVEKKIVPPLNIIAPALETAKYCINDDLLREMFAELIANSTNSDFSDIIHPSFARVIEQFSHLDALHLSLFKKAGVLGIVDYNVKLDVTAQFLTNVMLELDSCDDIVAISASITNLIRLGLLYKDLNVQVKDITLYEKFTKSELTEQITEHLVNQGFSETMARTPKIISTSKGIIRPTVYGQNFIKVCL